MQKLPCTAILLVCAALVSAVAPVQAQKADDQSQQRGTWTGEVVDLSCYLATGAVGDANKACHLTKRDGLRPSGVKNGQPMGLLTDDGTLVLLVPEVVNVDAFQTLAGRVGEQVRVKGRMVKRNARAMGVLFPSGDE